MARSLSRGPTGRDELIASNISRSNTNSRLPQRNSQTGSSGEKRDDKNIVYGNKKGQIRFGHLHIGDDASLSSNVQSGVMLQALDSLHYMTMDNDGIRKGWTLNRCPGPYSIICASDHAGVMQSEKTVTPEGIGFLLLAENGDIVIRAPKGKIRMSAIDIDIQANGYDNRTGVVNIDSNGAVNVKTPIFDVNADTRIRLYTANAINIIGNTSLTFSSNFINGLTSTSSSIIKPNKCDPTSVIKYGATSLYTT